VAVLAAHDLTIEYATGRGLLRAVDHVSFTVEEAGSTLGIIGESGSGKTSMVSLLTRVYPRNTARAGGTVVFDGQDISALSAEEYRRRVRWSRIAVVFQGAMNSFNPVLRVGRQVGERLLLDGRLSKREVTREVERLFELVGLTRDVARAYPHELSGGMKQRASIASALSMGPSLLILDEPTSALDVSVQAQIMNLLKRLKGERKLTYLFITHDIALAADIADTIAVVHAGELRELGPADDVLTSPRDPYTQQLLASVPRLHGDRPPSFLAGAPPDPLQRPAGCRFHPRCPRTFAPCAVRPPALVTVAEGHMARCWLHADAPGTAGAAAGDAAGGAAGAAGTAGTAEDSGAAEAAGAGSAGTASAEDAGRAVDIDAPSREARR